MDLIVVSSNLCYNASSKTIKQSNIYIIFLAGLSNVKI